MIKKINTVLSYASYGKIQLRKHFNRRRNVPKGNISFERRRWFSLYKLFYIYIYIENFMSPLHRDDPWNDPCVILKRTFLFNSDLSRFTSRAIWNSYNVQLPCYKELRRVHYEDTTPALDGIRKMKEAERAIPCELLYRRYIRYCSFNFSQVVISLRQTNCFVK